MRETERKQVQKTNQIKRASKPDKKGQKPQEKNGGRILKGKETDIKATSPTNSRTLGNDSKEEVEEESDPETVNDSVSSQGDPQTVEDEKLERASRISRNGSSDSSSHALRANSDNGVQIKTSKSAPKNTTKPTKGPSKVTTKSAPKNMKVHPKAISESSEELDDIPLEEVKQTTDEASSSAQSFGSDDETVNTAEHFDHEDRAALEQQVQEMESRIEKLEEELREVAALEVALYSVVPEHGNSAHKVHTPARRLSRLYIHACKYWSQDKRATVARNVVSGLVLVSKSCGNDVPRLTFWLSNAVVLREIISQSFGSSCSSSSLTKILESSGGKKGDGKRLSLKPSSNGVLHFVDNWQESRTFTAALERVESWIFSRIVESIWWQAFTPNMQPPIDNPSIGKAVVRLSGPALGDQQQGRFSIDLWNNAFRDAFNRLCPVRAGGHECGCLPVLARRVMKQCVARLDVAMFNAILRESAHEIPTDPVSDPIVDSKVLPIPAGDLSFGSGAQLKNSVGNWSRWLNESFGMALDDCAEDGHGNSENDDRPHGSEKNHFNLLNALSDLLMLPKDMLMDRTIRMEVCPSIHLSLVKRILCNFSPDEFCPDPVPGTVLEALNAECIIERRLSLAESTSSFPYPAAPVVYTPPSSANIAEKVAEVDRKSQFSRTPSSIQRKGYTSDEELDEIDSPLASIVDKTSSAQSENGNGNIKDNENKGSLGSNARYELLREVWRATT
ncbi:PREDICTED: uncharacterized protein LOC109182259 isoform X2 [Ipomoea nil]|uniref:uncharacterized protein LOC109182259 isoform X2 n=1 Tax=Ipomoea nil TaxID=35883 RepID=UPI000901CFEF|nr:PREDICTED: uncharacterized protein LOC109182259 isoform X2 [Ipomoea nil]